MTVGQRIEQKRKEKGLSMEALGEMLGVGRSAINKWEKGHSQGIGRDKILKMANIFECDPAWLGGYSEEEPQKTTDSHTYLHLEIVEDPNIDKEKKEEIAIAVKKYNKYKHLPPEIQKTIDVLLEQVQSDS